MRASRPKNDSVREQDPDEPRDASRAEEGQGRQREAGGAEDDQVGDGDHPEEVPVQLEGTEGRRAVEMILEEQARSVRAGR